MEDKSDKGAAEKEPEKKKPRVKAAGSKTRANPFLDYIASLDPALCRTTPKEIHLKTLQTFFVSKLNKHQLKEAYKKLEMIYK
jgi:hypothetical protein